jgi:ketosteroid isomerase-like protein
MTTTEQANLALALDYMASLENGATPELLERVFTPDVVQEEFPEPADAQRRAAGGCARCGRAPNAAGR